jgi:hypothetical protein
MFDLRLSDTARYTKWDTPFSYWWTVATPSSAEVEVAHDADLAGTHDKDALAKLPVEKREVCQKLWSDVAELLKEAGDAK